MNSSGGNFDSSFDAEKGVGTIVIAKPLDAEQRSIYNMSVEVTDGTNVAVTQVRHQLITVRMLRNLLKSEIQATKIHVEVVNYVHGFLVS